MKTTLVIDDQVMVLLKLEAARRKKTMSELVETALRRFLEQPTAQTPVPELPRFRGGRARVDISNRESLYRIMEEA